MASDGIAPKTSSSEGWKERIIIPTIMAGIVGGGAGLVSKHRKSHGLANISATYAANFAIVTGCYCGAREFVRASRASEPGDLINSAIGGFGTGAILGRLQGGQIGAIRYSVIFAVVGTTVDYATLRLKPILQSYSESIFENSENSQQKTDSWLRLPEWSPIQVLDEEALAEKRAQEQQFYAQRALVPGLQRSNMLRDYKFVRNYVHQSLLVSSLSVLALSDQMTSLTQQKEGQAF